MNFTFDGSISREVLNNYLSHAITHTGVGQDCFSPSQTFEDDLRMFQNEGAKFIGRAAFAWEETNEEEHFRVARERAELAHQMDPELVLQACVFECITKSFIDTVPVPPWVFQAFARRGWDGRQFNLEPVVETESYGISYQLKYTRNTTGALSMFKWTLRTAAKAAEYLGEDPDKISGWREVADHLAPYPTFQVGSGPVIGGNEMAFPRYTRGDHFMFTGYYPLNLADEYNLDSPQEIKDLMTRTADALGSSRNWEPYVLTGASKEYIPRSYAKGAVRIENHTMLAKDLLEAPERLMNSRSGRIHLFPAVPDWTVAAFQGFLARGGFSVSAARNEKGVTAVTVEASRSIPCQIMNPWPGREVTVTDLETGSPVPAELDRSNGECLVFQAEKGRRYSLDKMAD